MSIVRAGTQDLFVFDQGQGPPLLLVHGFPLNQQMWREQMAAFSSRLRVIAPDLRGFGSSPPGGGDTTSMEDFADDLNSLLDAMEVREPVTLCGLSMGGYIAFQFWRKYSARVARLILCDTRAAADTPEAAKNRLEMANRTLVEGAGVATGMLPKLLSPSTQQRQPDLVAFVRGMIESTHPRGIAAAQRGMAVRPDVTPLMPRINVPTLVIVGTDDAITTAAEMQTLAAPIPGSTFVNVPEAGHLSPLENPDAVNRAIQRFLGI